MARNLRRIGLYQRPFTRANAGDTIKSRFIVTDYRLPALTRVTRIYDRIDLKGQPFTRAHEGGAD